MDVDQAVGKIPQDWFEIARKRVGYELVLDEHLTVEYEWGWVFSFVPVDQTLPGKVAEYAIDRETGYTTPVGTKGVEWAAHMLMEWRKQNRK